MREAQTKQVLRHMELYGEIDALTAMRDYRCMRLAARIADLKAQGVSIWTEMRSENGKRWAVYGINS